MSHNGWKNYETWRVNLEVFNDYDYFIEIFNINADTDVFELAEQLQEYLAEIFEINVDGERASLVLSYAHAFVSNVDYKEIAKHMIESVKQEAE